VAARRALPVRTAVLDGGLFSGEGRGSIDAILMRNGDGADVAVAAFDVLQLNGADVMREPWSDRCKRLVVR
jgi:ATP-dependent DNA ligase